MKKIIIRIAMVFMIMIICIPLTGKINAELKRVVDKASLFSSDEIISLENRIKEISTIYEMDIVIVTTDNVEGKSSREYSDDFFDYEGYGLGNENSGILMLINMEDREVYISTSGKGINYFTDNRIESILDDVYSYLSDGDYIGGSEAFLSSTERFLQSGIPSNQYTVDENGNRVESSGDIAERIGISILIALIVSSVVCGIVVFNYRKPIAVAEESYIDRSSIKFTKRSDRFITSHTTSRKIPKNDNNSSGGGSTTHTSSSGNSHGGGGRSF